ncbi:VOC family protein [Streptomyces sp. ST2-7A]|uniref:VOC family protein n=1 Tax=Streptomyces sp. ST2-7A TaxID=2907214 RepID=UPI001F39869D|nr:VOC family protein [Streptomyces sp. ST2-7A]MCE7082850.1 VOC family protein [Streptomyces sp. ST2-7A]
MAIATMGITVLDCPDPRGLADFYAAVLGGTVEGEPGDEWVTVRTPDGGKPLGFQRSEGYRPPEWPSTEHGQQLHLDLDVPRERIDEAERQVLDLGARAVQGDDGGRLNFRVYLDPVGHPFCLCLC